MSVAHDIGPSYEQFARPVRISTVVEDHVLVQRKRPTSPPSHAIAHHPRTNRSESPAGGHCHHAGQRIPHVRHRAICATLASSRGYSPASR